MTNGLVVVVCTGIRRAGFKDCRPPFLNSVSRFGVTIIIIVEMHKLCISRKCLHVGPCLREFPFGSISHFAFISVGFFLALRELII